MIWVVVGIAIVAVALIAIVMMRGRRTPDGVATFQRQIDALSPEARRPVVRRLEDAARRDEPDGPEADGGDPADPYPRSGDTGGVDGA